MWGICRRAEPAVQRLRAARGFTLLELLVVLSILGVATALAAPAVSGSIDAWRRQAAVDAVVEQVRGWPADARSAGRPLLVTDDPDAADRAELSVPEGWELVVPQPWRVRANGACEGGMLQLLRNGSSVELEVLAPFCEIAAGEAG